MAPMYFRPLATTIQYQRYESDNSFPIHHNLHLLGTVAEMPMSRQLCGGVKRSLLHRSASSPHPRLDCRAGEVLLSRGLLYYCITVGSFECIPVEMVICLFSMTKCLSPRYSIIAQCFIIFFRGGQHFLNITRT